MCITLTLLRTHRMYCVNISNITNFKYILQFGKSWAISQYVHVSAKIVTNCNEFVFDLFF